MTYEYSKSAIFAASKIYTHNKGWFVDLSQGSTTNPDCYWWFSTRRQAEAFLELVNSGTDARDARHYVEQSHHAAAALGKIGGASRSEAKQTASRINGTKGGRPKKS